MRQGRYLLSLRNPVASQVHSLAVLHVTYRKSDAVDPFVQTAQLNCVATVRTGSAPGVHRPVPPVLQVPLTRACDYGTATHLQANHPSRKQFSPQGGHTRQD
jgi:hypothetical protein